MTKTQTRKRLASEVVQVQAINAEIERLQMLGHQRLARAGMLAEMLGFDSLDDAAATLTEEEVTKAQAEIAVSMNGTG